jgi:hypothetical protein
MFTAMRTSNCVCFVLGICIVPHPECQYPWNVSIYSQNIYLYIMFSVHHGEGQRQEEEERGGI